MRGKIKETNDANVHFTSILFQIKPIEITVYYGSIHIEI